MYSYKHPRSLRSLDEAMRLLEALEVSSVWAKGFETADPALITQLIAATPSDDTELSWSGGSLADIWPELAAFACSGAFCRLNLYTPGGRLLIWTGGNSYVDARLADRRAAFEEIVATPLSHRSTPVFRDGHPTGKIQLAKLFEHDPDKVKLETTSSELAMAMFRRVDDLTNREACVFRPSDAGKPALTALIATLGLPVKARFGLPPRTAGALSEQFPGAALEWQGGGLIITFPQLEFRYTTTNDDHGARRTQIDHALSQLDNS